MSNVATMRDLEVLAAEMQLREDDPELTFQFAETTFGTGRILYVERGRSIKRVTLPAPGRGRWSYENELQLWREAAARALEELREDA